MREILVISDTHANQVLLRQILKCEESASMIIHLGDFYEDLDNNEDLTCGKEIKKVPGIFHTKYYSGKLPFFLNFSLDNYSFLCLHSLVDIRKTKAQADIVLFGHTHKPEIYKEKGVFYINPGHLKASLDRGYTASYCLLIIKKNQIRVKFKDYKCNLIKDESLT